MSERRVHFHARHGHAHPDHGVEQAATQGGSLREQVIAALRGVYDPEIPVNLYDLGLIYDLTLHEDNVVSIEMTLTAPACPVADLLSEQVENAVSAVPGVKAVSVRLVWDPPWDESRMNDVARLELGMF